MGMLRLLLVMSNSDRCCPTVPGDRGWNHCGESWMDMEDGQAKRTEGRGQHAGDDTEG